MVCNYSTLQGKIGGKNSTWPHPPPPMCSMKYPHSGEAHAGKACWPRENLSCNIHGNNYLYFGICQSWPIGHTDLRSVNQHAPVPGCQRVSWYIGVVLLPLCLMYGAVPSVVNCILRLHFDLCGVESMFLTMVTCGTSALYTYLPILVTNHGHSQPQQGPMCLLPYADGYTPVELFFRGLSSVFRGWRALERFQRE